MDNIKKARKDWKEKKKRRTGNEKETHITQEKQQKLPYFRRLN